jgi:hypothetical protein
MRRCVWCAAGWCAPCGGCTHAVCAGCLVRHRGCPVCGNQGREYCLVCGGDWDAEDEERDDDA